ncbi:MAG: ubiquitin carboxyl-terminal hydrolase family protein [Bacteroidota bacterium]
MACVGLLTCPVGCDKIADKNSVLPPQPGGISNVGLTCYVNATMQMMAAFYPNMFDPKRVEDPEPKKLAEVGSKVIQTINQGKTVDSTQAKALFAALESVHNTDEKEETDFIKLNKQGDASEVLQTIFDALKFPGFESRSFLEHPSTEETKEAHGDRNNVTSRMLRLNIAPLGQNAATPLYPKKLDMDYLLHNHFSGDTLNGYKWDREKINGVKQKPLINKLSKLANGILPVQIVRHAYANAGGKIHTKLKNNSSLTFKKEYFYEDTQAISYDLRGFILQSGSLYAGHYVAWVYREDRNQWYYISDSSVEQRTAKDAKDASEDAYILFYQTR